MQQLGGAGPEGIRALRKRRGWTQAQLARAMGTDPVTVSRWERGVARPRRSAVRRLAALGLAQGPVSKAGFMEDPAARFRKLDRALREQLSFKRRARRLA